jgi:hypothetical protein
MSNKVSTAAFDLMDTIRTADSEAGGRPAVDLAQLEPATIPGAGEDHPQAVVAAPLLRRLRRRETPPAPNGEQATQRLSALPAVKMSDILAMLAIGTEREYTRQFNAHLPPELIDEFDTRCAELRCKKRDALRVAMTLFIQLTDPDRETEVV